MLKHALMAAAITFAAAPAILTAPTPATAQAAMQTMTKADFIQMTASSNMFELQSSQLAEKQSKNKSVQSFAEMMIKDHTAATQKFKSLVKGETVPTTMVPKHAQMLQQLQSASGADFDRAYIMAQTQAHQEAIQLFEAYAASGDDAELKAFAQQTLPALRQHLAAVQKIQTST